MARRRSSPWSSYSQPTSAEISKKAEQSAKRSKKSGRELHPVVVSGRKIAKKWWGVAWCENLERYADFASRIDRGKRYVRSGAVLDLQIEAGHVSALVQGSRRAPYNVDILIDPMDERQCEAILSRCSRRIGNLESLVCGDFPQDLQDLFSGRDGLFPNPREIQFFCTCPDWASMCKHVAAALYGVGVRLDEEPLLFFELRGIDINRFIDAAVANRVERMLDNAKAVSDRMLDDRDLTELFGVL